MIPQAGVAILPVPTQPFLQRVLALSWILATATLTTNTAAQQLRGVLKERPTRGRFVKTERGYMVPYVASIPGSTAKFEMVPISGGILSVLPPNSKRAVRIEIPPFWIGKHEVTWDEYAEYCSLHPLFRSSANQKRRRQVTPRDRDVDGVTAPTEIYDTSTRMGFATSPKSPAITMTQFGARQYTKWLSLLTRDCYRLPSEAEWTYACLAGSSGPWSTGADEAKLRNVAVYTRDKKKPRRGPSPIGSKGPNAFGIHDMHGNVAEWVLDGFRAGGLASLKPGTYPLEATIHPQGGRHDRVACGGGFSQSANQCGAWSRARTTEDWWRDEPQVPVSPHWYAGRQCLSVGFRVVRPLQDLQPEKMRRFWNAQTQPLINEIQAFKGWGIVDPGLATVPRPGRKRFDRTYRPWLGEAKR